jgi:hypothetical protein
MVKYKQQMKKIEGWSKDGTAKMYTNKICGDNHIPTLAFLDYHIMVGRLPYGVVGISASVR